jgi:hypothetical protein
VEAVAPCERLVEADAPVLSETVPSKLTASASWTFTPSVVLFLTVTLPTSMPPTSPSTMPMKYFLITPGPTIWALPTSAA